METWNEHELTLTVGKTLKLEALAREKKIPELDVIGNPVVCITALRRPSIVVELFRIFADTPLPVDSMTGDDFTDLRETIERLILGFFQKDPEMTELLTEILTLEKEARQEMNAAALRAEAEHIEEIRKEHRPETETKTPPAGGTSSGTASEPSVASRGVSQSPNSSTPPKPRPVLETVTTPP